MDGQTGEWYIVDLKEIWNSCLYFILRTNILGSSLLATLMYNGWLNFVIRIQLRVLQNWTTKFPRYILISVMNPLFGLAFFSPQNFQFFLSISLLFIYIYFSNQFFQSVPLYDFCLPFSFSFTVLVYFILHLWKLNW